jgi:hypothetical protein
MSVAAADHRYGAVKYLLRVEWLSDAALKLSLRQHAHRLSATET